jgi:hypothetical protein
VLHHDRGNDDVREQVADLSQAHRGDEDPSGQRRHRVFISIILEIILDTRQYFYIR